MSTTAFPATKAGASSCATRFKGKLKGVMATTTPTGSRRKKLIVFLPLDIASVFIVSPCIVRIVSADKVTVSMQRSTSTRANAIGLPTSSVMVLAIVCEEVFAPIVSLVRVDSLDDALPRMNNSPYGLQFSVFTNDLGVMNRAIDELDAGGIVINDMPTLRFDIQPYGGVKLSGVGREGPRFAIEEMTEIKSVVIC